MIIKEIETIRIEEFPNLIWVRIHTKDGMYGLGETFMASQSIESYMHFIAHHLIGQSAHDIERLTGAIDPYVGARGSGVERRAQSAINMALWDLAGKAAGMPLCQLLGGSQRDRTRLYNTCAGYRYMRSAKSQSVSNWGLDERSGPYEDLDGFLHRSDELAHSLLEMGITAMKIWPFDLAAEKNHGLDISAEDLKAALRPIEMIRKSVGSKMDIMIEFHSMWTLPAAIKIARALSPYETYWHEDPIRMNSLSSLIRYQEVSRSPICASETISGKHGYRDLLETGFSGVVMTDVSWCGGISEARNISVMADAWDLPVTFHDCTGPIVLAASAHLAAHCRNTVIQEFVRASYYGWYQEVAINLPEISGGFILPSGKPGIGSDLCEKRLQKDDVIRQRISSE